MVAEKGWGRAGVTRVTAVTWGIGGDLDIGGNTGIEAERSWGRGEDGSGRDKLGVTGRSLKAN